MKNANDDAAKNGEMAEWQKISEITPEREKTMAEDERDEGIRKLLAEVERLVHESFARGERVPAGERTLFWDPLERICRKLEISRVKLSALSRELTGMRAHEISDRILAKKTLHQVMEKRIVKLLRPEFEKVRGQLDRSRVREEAYRATWCKSFWKMVKIERTGLGRARCAAELGFANPSRLSRACLLAYGMSIDELEANVVIGIVQKFLDGIREEKNLPQSTQRTQRNGDGRTEDNVAAPTFADEVVRDAVDAVMKGRVSA